MVFLPFTCHIKSKQPLIGSGRLENSENTHLSIFPYVENFIERKRDIVCRLQVHYTEIARQNLHEGERERVSRYAIPVYLVARNMQAAILIERGGGRSHDARQGETNYIISVGLQGSSQ